MPVAPHADKRGKIYLVGAYVDGWMPTDEAHEYDPTNDIWRARARMPTPRGALAAAVLGGPAAPVADVRNPLPVSTGLSEAYRRQSRSASSAPRRRGSSSASSSQQPRCHVTATSSGLGVDDKKELAVVEDFNSTWFEWRRKNSCSVCSRPLLISTGSTPWWRQSLTPQ